jgi:hypothetical protein
VDMSPQRYRQYRTANTVAFMTHVMKCASVGQVVGQYIGEYLPSF